MTSVKKLIVTNLIPELTVLKKISLLLSFSHDKNDMFPEFRRSIACRKRVKFAGLCIFLTESAARRISYSERIKFLLCVNVAVYP